MDPDWRVQETCTGATPPVAVAWPNVTGTCVPAIADAVTFCGQLIVSAGVGTGLGWRGGVGAVGWLLHADSTDTMTPTDTRPSSFMGSI